MQVSPTRSIILQALHIGHARFHSSHIGARKHKAASGLRSGGRLIWEHSVNGRGTRAWQARPSPNGLAMNGHHFAEPSPLPDDGSRGNWENGRMSLPAFASLASSHQTAVLACWEWQRGSVAIHTSPSAATCGGPSRRTHFGATRAALSSTAPSKRRLRVAGAGACRLDGAIQFRMKDSMRGDISSLVAWPDARYFDAR